MSLAESDGGRVTWQDRLPWLILLRVFRPAVSIRCLVCSATALLGTVAGWRIIWRMFAHSTDPLITRLRMSTPDIWPAWPWEPGYSQIGHEGVVHRWTELPVIGSTLNDIVANVTQITLPFQFLFSEKIGPSGVAYSLLCGLWAVAVWGFFAGIITRSVAMNLAREESISWKQASRFAHSRWLSYISAPFFPLLGILLLTLPLMVLGLIARLDIGVLLVGLVWPLALLCGLAMAVLLLLLFFGWPLMWSTISVEGTDAFDALSRSYAYVFYRPLRYLFYALVAAVLGSLGWLLVGFFGSAIIQLASWGLSWGCNSTRAEVVTQMAIDSGPGYYGVVLIAFWNSAVRLLVAAFPLSFFFCASTAIYLLLRRDVDAAELDEIHLDQDDTFGLPNLVHDEKGVPGAGDLGGTTQGDPANLREEE